ncbi:MAG: hypothetical protein QNK03_28725 [Myxococcota bacterium]|nr:hypothetical protein [Myxococcota bacterium]
MKYDLRNDPGAARKPEFLAWLLDTTANDLRAAGSDPEQIKTAVFLFLHRAYEAGIQPEEVVELFGISDPNILSTAGCQGQTDQLAMGFYEQLEPSIAGTYGF